MTTGFVRIKIGEYWVAGNFQEGRITDGVIRTKDDLFTGNFDDNGLLHGEGISKNYRRNVIYSGTFENGALKTGKLFKDGTLIEEGIFETVGSNVYLLEGKKYEPDGYVLNGKFKRYHLVDGEAIYRDDNSRDIVTYKGTFNQGTMEKGIVIFHEIQFTCEYELVYDHVNGCQNFAKCSVNYGGDLRQLNIKQLMMYLCSGEHSLQASKFFDDYLNEYSGHILDYLEVGIFKRVPNHLQLGMNLVINNYKSSKRVSTENASTNILINSSANSFNDNIMTAIKYLY